MSRHRRRRLHRFRTLSMNSTAAGGIVRVFDDLSTGLQSNLAHVRPAPESVVGDLADAAAVARAAEGASVVYHLGRRAASPQRRETDRDAQRLRQPPARRRSRRGRLRGLRGSSTPRVRRRRWVSDPAWHF